MEAAVFSPIEAVVGYARVHSQRVSARARNRLEHFTIELVVHNFPTAALVLEYEHAFLGACVQPSRVWHDVAPPLSSASLKLDESLLIVLQSNYQRSAGPVWLPRFAEPGAG